MSRMSFEATFWKLWTRLSFRFVNIWIRQIPSRIFVRVCMQTCMYAYMHAKASLEKEWEKDNKFWTFLLLVCRRLCIYTAACHCHRPKLAFRHSYYYVPFNLCAFALLFSTLYWMHACMYIYACIPSYHMRRCRLHVQMNYLTSKICFIAWNGY